LRKKRRGFTLVEVIVVLVILAILAAIAIPALTGYIDKVKWKSMIHMGRTQVVAIQTMFDELYAKNGGVDIAATLEFFPYVESYAEGQGYDIARFTDKGLAEYTSLTGDTQSNFVSGNWPTDGIHASFTSKTDLSGALKVYIYRVNNYFTGEAMSTLDVVYIQNAEADDPVINALKTTYVGQNHPGIVTGFSVWQHNNASWKRLD
jgi:prepilin-type N-terminal cleavage/methylation domain-containing protein